MTEQLQALTKEILSQIGNDIEILRGSEAQLLAKNGDFLDRLSVIMGDVDDEIQTIEETTKVIKDKVRDKGYM